MCTDSQNQLLVAILDQLVPANLDKAIPGAGALGVAEFLWTATDYATDPIGTVIRLLDSIAAQADNFVILDNASKVAVLKQIEATHKEDFAVLIRLTYMGYYSRADVRPFFGVGVHPIHPKGYHVLRESTELMAELTAPVRKRGPIYRDV
tara:strand:+ start:2241 stop:2690 length:450 start_codon:yes stop_codon:yes gene_type:complete